jgi:hypothetical protein
MDHWRGRSTATGGSAGRNDDGRRAGLGRIARRFGAHGEDDVADTVRDLPLRPPGSAVPWFIRPQRRLLSPSELAGQERALKIRVSHRKTVVVAAVLAAVMVAGCGSGGGNGSGGSGSTPVGSSGTNVEVTIAGGKVAPDPSRKVEVATGDHVHLSVTSDHADEVHVHGYDIEKEVSAGGTVTIDFTADIPGQFEVEAHKLSPSLLFTLVVK